MADDGTGTRRKGRKWLRFESEWVRKKRKTEKDSGEAYTTYKGDPKPAKQLIAITCRCHLRCSQKLNLTERKRIFDEFYMLKNNDAQNKYLYGLIHKQAVKRKRAKASTIIDITSGAAMVLGYQHLREDSQLAHSDSNVHVITFDLQQNLPVPTLTHSAMFYLRQLWVYNFGIHECSGGNGIVCAE